MFPTNNDAYVGTVSLNLLWLPTCAWPILAGHHETTWSLFKNKTIWASTQHGKPCNLLSSFGHTFQIAGSSSINTDKVL
jgi:hypothetical protein